jgi:hypothetical protein
VEFASLVRALVGVGGAGSRKLAVPEIDCKDRLLDVEWWEEKVKCVAGLPSSKGKKEQL